MIEIDGANVKLSNDPERVYITKQILLFVLKEMLKPILKTKDELQQFWACMRNFELIVESDVLYQCLADT